METVHLKIREYLDILEREGALLARHAEHAGPDAPVPSCPGWTVRDLLRHTGGVHRWATSYLAGRRTERMPRAEKAAFMANHPADDKALYRWYLDGLAVLTGTLAEILESEPGADCWAFLPAPSPLAFWARRQAHETAVHRADAAFAADEGFTFAADFASDGIDEMLGGFLLRMPGLRTDDGRLRTLLVDPEDAPGSWLVRIGPDGASADHYEGPHPIDSDHKPDCLAGGRAEHLYLALWNRVPFGEESVHGDPAVLDVWRDHAIVYWS